jgi:cytochrome d ubiquinol oxidase subunit I
VLAGWITTEVGRQPYVIYGLMRTAEARAPIDAPAVATSLLVFVIVYFLVFGAGTIYILRLMKHAPHHGETAPAQAPIRSAGITPGGSLRRSGGDPDGRSGADEEAR